MLANLAINEPYSFKAIVDELKIQGRLELDQKPKMSYLDALSQGFLVRGKYIDT